MNQLTWRAAGQEPGFSGHRAESDCPPQTKNSNMTPPTELFLEFTDTLRVWEECLPLWFRLQMGLPIWSVLCSELKPSCVVVLCELYGHWNSAICGTRANYNMAAVLSLGKSPRRPEEVVWVKGGELTREQRAPHPSFHHLPHVPGSGRLAC